VHVTVFLVVNEQRNLKNIIFNNFHFTVFRAGRVKRYLSVVM